MTDNQAVVPGAVLVTIDDADFRVAVARAEAERARLLASSGTARATAAAQGSMIAEAQAALVAARAEAVRAESDRARFATLLKERWVPRATYETKAAEAASRTAAVAQAEAAIAAARANRTAAVSGQGGAGAAVEGADTALAQARLDLANTVLHAPLAGVVGNKTVRVGQYVKVGQQLMVVVPLGAVYVTANFKETQIGGMKPGQPVELAIDAYKKAGVAGRIASISPASGSRFSILPPENATGNFTKIVQRVPVKIVLDHPPADLRLVPGMSVEARVDVRSEPER